MLGRWFASIFVGPVYFSALVLQRLIGSSRERLSGAWSHRLEYGRFVAGLPAVAGLAALAVVAVWSRASVGRVESAYSARLHQALEERDYATAKLCGERLVGLDPRRDVYAFSLGQAYAGLGDVRHAAAIMRRLAPADAAGFPPAQLWVVARRLADPAPLRADELRQLEARLIRLREVPSYGDDAARVLADLYFRTGRGAMVSAEPTLVAAAESAPHLRLALAEVRAPRTSPEATKAIAEELVAEFRRRVQGRPDDVESRLLLARAQLLAGRVDAAQTVLREGLALGNDRRLGESLAAIDLDLFRLAVRRAAPDAVRRKLAVQALASLDAFAPPGDDAELERARLFGALGEYDRAQAAYAAVIDAFPVVRIEAAELLDRQGRAVEAKAEYAAVVRWYADADERTRRATPQARIAGPLAAVRLGDFERAVTWLKAQAADGGADAAVMRTLLVQAYAAWNDALRKTAGATHSERRLSLLAEALAAAPFDPAVMQRLLELAAEDDDAGRRARERFHRMIADGDAPASAYLLAGTEALMRGARDDGIRYLEQAFRLNPNSYAALNNLAWALASGDKPDLPRALTLADEARRRAPNDGNVRDTRGRILAKMKRWQEALDELEGAAPTMRGDAEYHRVIAEVYEALGLKELAKTNRDAARQAEQPPNPATN